jgi:hypothetical protein
MTDHKNLKRLIRARQARTGESYSAARAHLLREQAAREPIDARSLAALLRGAERSFQSIEWTYRVWRDPAREAEARRADAEQARRRGGAVTTYGPANLSELAAYTETTRFWRQGQQSRVEFHGGPRDGYYAVGDDRRWKLSDPRVGTKDHQANPTVISPLRRPLGHMLDPAPLIDLLDFRVTGWSAVLGRPTITARAAALPPASLSGVVMALYDFGPAAELYELAIDRERGVLLGMAACRDGQMMQTRETLAIRFDEPIATAVFTTSPDQAGPIEVPLLQFTDRAQTVIRFARQEARDLGFSHVGSEGLLLGLLRGEEELRGGVLTALGVTLDLARAETLKRVGSGERLPEFIEIPFTPRAEELLAHASQIAQNSGHQQAGTECLLIALKSIPEGVALNVLRALGIDPDAVRTTVDQQP